MTYNQWPPRFHAVEPVLGAGEHKLSLNDYLADPAPEPSLSPSIAHWLLSASPAHAWREHPRLNPDYRQEVSAKLDLGSAAHAILLENAGERIVIVHAKDYRTKEAQAARAEAHEQGKIPLLEEQYVVVDAMVTQAIRALNDSELKECFKKDGGESEVTFVWHGGGHTWLRTRPDRVSRDRRLLIDFKTTGSLAEPSTWTRTAILAHGYDLQAAFGVKAVSRLYSKEAHFIFVVQETEPPYAVSLVGLSPEWMEWADRKLNRAVLLWDQCMSTNHWPGYPNRVAWADLPAWAKARDLDRLWVGLGPGESIESL